MGVLPRQKRDPYEGRIVFGRRSVHVATKGVVTPEPVRIVGMWIDVEASLVRPGVRQFVQARFVLNTIEDDPTF